MFDAASFADRLLWTTLQGSLLLLLVWFVTSRVAFAKPRVRNLLWSVAFLHFLLGIVVSVPLPILPPKVVGAIEAVFPVKAMSFEEAQKFGEQQIQAQNAALEGGKPSMLLLSLWGVGTLICVGALTYREVRFQRKLRRESRTDERLQEAAGRVSARIGLRRVPTVIVSESLKTPCVSGVFRPNIFWPESLVEAFDSASEEAILAHEMIHVKNGDIAVAWLAALVRCVFFFNPILWIANREFGAQGEMLCDREVLQITQMSKKSYCQLLIDLAAQRPFPPSTTHAMAKDFRILHRRISHMTKNNNKQKGAVSIAVIAALAIATVVAIPVSATEAKFQLEPENPLLVDAADAMAPASSIIGDAGTTYTINPDDRVDVLVTDPGQGKAAEITPTLILGAKDPVNVSYCEPAPADDAVLNSKVTLAMKDTNVEVVLNTVAQQLNIHIDAGKLKGQPVTLKVDEVSLKVLLDVVSKNTGSKWVRVSERSFKFE